jgi:hypothetical protein
MPMNFIANLLVRRRAAQAKTEAEAIQAAQAKAEAAQAAQVKAEAEAARDNAVRKVVKTCRSLSAMLGLSFPGETGRAVFKVTENAVEAARKAAEEAYDKARTEGKTQVEAEAEAAKYGAAAFNADIDKLLKTTANK